MIVILQPQPEVRLSKDSHDATSMTSCFQNSLRRSIIQYALQALVPILAVFTFLVTRVEEYCRRLTGLGASGFKFPSIQPWHPYNTLSPQPLLAHYCTSSSPSVTLLSSRVYLWIDKGLFLFCWLLLCFSDTFPEAHVLAVTLWSSFTDKVDFDGAHLHRDGYGCYL